MPLNGIKVLEFAGLAPAPFCGMILADFGASVIRVDRANGSSELDCLKNGKRSLAVNLKTQKGIEIVKKLSTDSDVLIEPFRKGVMEKLGLGPQVLMNENPKLIYARLTGFGQNGPYSSRAGHDINFIALSGLLSLFGRKNENPIPPCNVLGDFAGGGLMCAFGIVLALLERSKSGRGQIIDCSMVEGAAYLGSWIFRSQILPIWGNSKGHNLIDTGSHFYETYKTKDNKYVAIGALEGEFYKNLVDKLNDERLQDQMSDFNNKKEIMAKIISTKTRDEWCSIFEGVDACFTPVLNIEEVSEFPHNKEREIFLNNGSGVVIPKPAPRLSRTPGESKGLHPPKPNGADTEEILLELGYSKQDIQKLNEDVVNVCSLSKL